MDLSLLGWGDLGWGDEMIYGALMTLAVATCSYALGIVFGAMASVRFSLQAAESRHRGNPPHRVDNAH